MSKKKQNFLIIISFLSNHIIFLLKQKQDPYIIMQYTHTYKHNKKQEKFCEQKVAFGS